MEYLTPALICAVLITALVRKKPLYRALTEGAAEGLDVIFKITPPIILISAAVRALEASGALEYFTHAAAPVTSSLHIPPQIIPLALIRPISGSGALGVLSSTLNTYGADSETGIMASVIMGSTETTFYVTAVYFGAANIRHPIRAILCAVAADIAGIIAGVYFTRLFT